jgi:hypothetical protein
MIALIIGFWLLWFFIALLIGKLWPESIDKGGLLSFNNKTIAFFVALALILIFKAF